jgi:hypothetical protein
MLIVFILHVDGELNASKTSFALKFNTALWMMTTGLQFAIGWWYSRAAVFYLPAAWFGPITWWLSFPFAPAGETITVFNTAYSMQLPACQAPSVVVFGKWLVDV